MFAHARLRLMYTTLLKSILYEEYTCTELLFSFSVILLLFTLFILACALHFDQSMLQMHLNGRKLHLHRNGDAVLLEIYGMP